MRHQRVMKILRWPFSIKRKNERRESLIDADREQVLDPCLILTTASDNASVWPEC